MDIMLDIETLGTSQDAVIAAIAAVAFEPNGSGIEDEFFETIDITMDQGGRSIDPSTVQWWLSQSKVAQANTFSDTGIELSLALSALLEFIEDHDPENVWCCGPTFDEPILAHACKSLMSAPWPVKFWRVRDVRTIRDLAAYMGVVPSFAGIPHHALHDAMHQAFIVQFVYREVVPAAVEA